MTAPAREVFFSADIEADGPIPGDYAYSMLSFGLSVLGRSDGQSFVPEPEPVATFYAELAPISQKFDAAALAVSGLDRDRLASSGADPAAAMTNAARWVIETSEGATPVLVCYPKSFDWLWLYWYFMQYCPEGSPFGFADVVDVKTMIWSMVGGRFTDANRGALPASLRERAPRTHHALDDALAQGQLFTKLLYAMRSTMRCS